MSPDHLSADPMSHTPGPWSAQQRRWGYPEVAGGPERRLWEVFADGSCIAGCTIYSKDEADARLIAAAPELLQALDMLYTEIADYIQRNNLGAMDNQSMRLARAALGKAVANHLSSKLVSQIRDHEGAYLFPKTADRLLKEAADEIERLRRDNEELRRQVKVLDAVADRLADNVVQARKEFET